MNTNEYLVPICGTVTNPEILWNVQMATPTLKQEIPCIDASSSNSSDPLYIPEHLQTSACENYYDNKMDVLEEIKKESPEDVSLQSDCSLNSQNDKLEIIDKEVKRENTDEDISLDMKKEDYKLEFEITIKTERQEQEDVLYNDGDTRAHTDVPVAPQGIEHKFVGKTVKNRVNCKKKERQKRYRERNREKLRKREAERRKFIQYFQSNARPYNSSTINRIELQKVEKINSNPRSATGSVGTQTSSVQSEQTKAMNALERKKERQQRYRERNREKLKEREAERRRRLQKSEIVAESSISSNMDLQKLAVDQWPKLDHN